MSGEEQAPSGGGYHKRMSPKEIERMKKLWKRAKSISELSARQHEEHEVPTAEEELRKNLEEMEDKNRKDPLAH